MLRAPLLFGLGALSISMGLAAAFAGCGDLVIPPNDTGDGGTDDGATDAADAAPEIGFDSGGADVLVGPDGAPVTIDCTDDGSVGHPVQLGCTGLYSDWTTQAISPDAQPYDPGLHMWADSAESFRYVYLPPGAKIDTTNLDEWSFPVGTKFWQELRLLGKKVETRFLWKVAPQQWFRTTYVWSNDQTMATELTGGQQNVLGLGYEIPATELCAECHSGRIDFVLGFELVSLASPNATGLNLSQLRAKNLMTAPPAATPVIPGDPTTVAAFGWMHANCGTSCHNRSPGAFAGTGGLFMRLGVQPSGALPSDPRQTDMWTTTVGVGSMFQPAGVDAGSFKRVTAGDPSTSTVAYRAERRDISQMPPIATHQVDFADTANVNAWIKALPP